MQYHKLKLPSGTPAKVALAFENGDPAVIEAPRYRGTVIQIATSADSGWTTWPLHRSYPPIMEQIVFEAASGRLAERNVRVGQPLDQAMPASGATAAVSVTMPGGKVVASKLQAAGDVSLFHFEETDLSGPYRVKFGPPLATESLFAANPDPVESDPAKLDRAGLGRGGAGLDVRLFDELERIDRQRGGREPSRRVAPTLADRAARTLAARNVSRLEVRKPCVPLIP